MNLDSHFRVYQKDHLVGSSTEEARYFVWIHMENKIIEAIHITQAKKCSQPNPHHYHYNHHHNQEEPLLKQEPNRHI